MQKYTVFCYLSNVKITKTDDPAHAVVPTRNDRGKLFYYFRPRSQLNNLFVHSAAYFSSVEQNIFNALALFPSCVKQRALRTITRFIEKRKRCITWLKFAIYFTLVLSRRLWLCTRKFCPFVPARMSLRVQL